MNPSFHIAKRKYLYDVIKALITSFILSGMGLSFFFEEDTQEVIELSFQQSLLMAGLFFISWIIQLIIYWLILRKYRFSEHEQSFLIEKGLFFKKKLDIPYKNIHTISIKRGFFDLILGLSTLQVDTGTTHTFNPEAHLVLDKTYAIILKEFIEKRKLNEVLPFPSPDDEKKVRSSDTSYFYEPKGYTLMVMGILKPGFLLFAYFIGFVTLTASSVIIYLHDEVMASSIFFLSLATGFGVIIVFGLILMIVHWFKFYHYRLSINGNDLTYQYGLLNKVEFKFPINRINAVHITQSILYQAFHYYELNVSAIGIGDQINQENGKIESKSLLPIANIEVVNEMLHYLGYDTWNDSTEYKPQKFKYLNFILLPLFFYVLISLIPYSFVSTRLLDFIFPMIFHAILTIFVVIGLILQLKHHHFLIGDPLVRFQRGAYTIKQTLVKTHKIQMITYTQGPLLILERIGNILVNYKDLGGIIIMNSYNRNDFLNLKDRI